MAMMIGSEQDPLRWLNDINLGRQDSPGLAEVTEGFVDVQENSMRSPICGRIYTSGSDFGESEEDDSPWSIGLTTPSASAQRLGEGMAGPFTLDHFINPSQQPQDSLWPSPREAQPLRAPFALGGERITYVRIDEETGELQSCNAYGAENRPQQDAADFVEIRSSGYRSLMPDDESTPDAENPSEEAHELSSAHSGTPEPQLTSQTECRGCQGQHVSHTCGRGRSGRGKRLAQSNMAEHQTQKKAPHNSHKRKEGETRTSSPQPTNSQAENRTGTASDSSMCSVEGPSPAKRQVSKATGAALAVNRTLVAPAGLEGRLGSGSGWLTIKIKEPQPVNKCSYELCLNPYHTSGGWKWVTHETKAGGRDWTPYLGRLFCNACFTQFATTGSMSRKGRSWVPPQLPPQENEGLVKHSPEQRRHAGGMNLRKAMHASHKINI